MIWYTFILWYFWIYLILFLAKLDLLAEEIKILKVGQKYGREISLDFWKNSSLKN